MKPARFEYRRMASLPQVLDELRQLGTDATLLAGGQSLIVQMNARLARPRVLLDLNPLRALSGVRLHEKACSIGAMTRYRVLEPPGLAARAVPMLGRAVSYVGHPAIRNVGTVGGSVAFADAPAELPAALLCLKAEVRLLSSIGERRLAMDDFLVGQGVTARQPDELVAGIDLALPRAGERHAFHEFNLRHNGPPVVCVALRTLDDGAGGWRDVRLTAGGLYNRAVSLPTAARLLGNGWLLPDIAELREAVACDVDVLPTPIFPAAFKLQIAAALIHRAAREIRG